MRRYEEPSNNWVNVLDYGAMCDGVTDDTEAFKRAIRSANNGVVPGTRIWKRAIYIPSNMLIASPEKIVIDASSLCLYGNAKANSHIIFTHENGGIMFERSNSLQGYEVEIKDLTFNGSGVTRDLLTANRLANFYIKDVFFSGWSETGYAINLTKCALVFFERLTIDGGTPEAGNRYKKSGIKLNGVSFIKSTSFNSWNLRRLFNLETACFNFTYKDSWTEYVKTVVEINPESHSFLHNKITLEGGTYSNGADMTDYSLITYNTTNEHNLFGNQLNMLNVQFYMNSTNTLLNDSFMNINGMAAKSNLGISIDNVNVVGWSFNEEQFFLKLNEEVGKVCRYIQILKYNLRVNGLMSPLKKTSNYVEVANLTEGLGSNHPVFRQGVKLADLPDNEGRVYYENGDYYAFYADGVHQLPKRNKVPVPNSKATDIETLKNDFNTLITQLKATGIIK